MWAQPLSLGDPRALHTACVIRDADRDCSLGPRWRLAANTPQTVLVAVGGQLLELKGEFQVRAGGAGSGQQNADGWP